MEKDKTRDQFKLSGGNLKVLETIPEMMNNKIWRRRIRELVIKYLVQKDMRKI